MAITEQIRQEMYRAFEKSVGKGPALALLEYLRPVGWADVATKDYVDHRMMLVEQRLETKLSLLDAKLETTESRLEAKFEERLRVTAMSIIGANIATNITLLGIVLGILKLT